MNARASRAEGVLLKTCESPPYESSLKREARYHQRTQSGFGVRGTNWLYPSASALQRLGYTVY